MTPTTEAAAPASILSLAASIVSAHVSHNDVGQHDLTRLIRDVYATLREVDQANPDRPVPAPTPRQASPSRPDILSCAECGMRMKMLKRHLQTVHGLTPESYRKKHKLSSDTPMVTSKYAALRSELAKASGLGKRPADRGRNAHR